MDPFRFIYRARLISIHDGDTVTLEVDLGGDVRASWPVRLLNVRAPELSQEGGQETLAVASEWLMRRSGKWPFVVETFKTKGDITKKSFERYLAWITDSLTGESLNQHVALSLVGKNYPAGR